MLRDSTDTIQPTLNRDLFCCTYCTWAPAFAVAGRSRRHRERFRPRDIPPTFRAQERTRETSTTSKSFSRNSCIPSTTKPTSRKKQARHYSIRFGWVACWKGVLSLFDAAEAATPKGPTEREREGEVNRGTRYHPLVPLPPHTSLSPHLHRHPLVQVELLHRPKHSPEGRGKPLRDEGQYLHHRRREGRW